MDVQENPPAPAPVPVPVPVPVPPNTPEREIRLVDVPVSNENTALNLMVSFLSLAQKRGTFSLDESAKIWECVQKFQVPSSA